MIDDLHEAGVRVLILSGGEPLLRGDIFQLADYARDKSFFVALSTNGTLIDEGNIARIAAARFDYVGISIDGLEAVHDDWRQLKGSFAASMHAIDLCRQHDIRVGLRTTLTQNNYPQLPALLALMREHDVQKFYLSHLNYSGRGKRSRKADAHHQMTRDAMRQLFEQAWDDVQHGRETDFVSGNNDADAILLLQWVEQHLPEHRERLEGMLRAWAATPRAAASPTSTTSATCTRTPTGGSTPWATCAASVSATSGCTSRPHCCRSAPASASGEWPLCRMPLAVDLQRQHRTRAWAQGDLWADLLPSDEEIGLPTPERIPSIAI